jgi:ribonuclease D
MDLLTSTDDLAAACARLSRNPFVTVDTEFMRETTYYPKLCLIQMAGPDEGVLVDPLAPDIDLAPFLGLMRDPAVTKVFHSARQDLEIVWNMGGLIPRPLFDSQVAAMVCGYGDSVSYEQLVNDLAKARVDKSSRFTDWSRRPLTEPQLAYALSDVTHLVKVYEALMEQLRANGRLSWLEDEMTVLLSPETYRGDPDNAWRRLAGRLRKAKEVAVLMEVAAWREREAQAVTCRAAACSRTTRWPTWRCRRRARSRRSGGSARSRTVSSARARGARSSPPWSGASRETRRRCPCRSAPGAAARTARCWSS